MNCCICENEAQTEVRADVTVRAQGSLVTRTRCETCIVSYKVYHIRVRRSYHGSLSCIRWVSLQVVRRWNVADLLQFEEEPEMVVPTDQKGLIYQATDGDRGVGRPARSSGGRGEAAIAEIQEKMMAIKAGPVNSVLLALRRRTAAEQLAPDSKLTHSGSH